MGNRIVDSGGALILLALLLAPASYLFGQEVPEEIDEEITTPANLELTRVEMLEGMVIGLQQLRLTDRRASILKEIQPRIDEISALDAKVREYSGLLDKMGAGLVKGRSLDPLKFKVDWNTGKIVAVDEQKEIK